MCLDAFPKNQVFPGGMFRNASCLNELRQRPGIFHTILLDQLCFCPIQSGNLLLDSRWLNVRHTVPHPQDPSLAYHANKVAGRRTTTQPYSV